MTLPEWYQHHRSARRVDELDPETAADGFGSRVRPRPRSAELAAPNTRAVGLAQEAAQPDFGVEPYSIGRDGRLAVPAHGSEDASLGQDAELRLRVGEFVEQARHGLVPAALFDGERPLADGRQEPLGLEYLARHVREAEPDETRAREDDRIDHSFAAFSETRVDVAAERDDLEIRAKL
jgi:hypothetical protein